MDDRLRSAESAIAFIQNEHERVLHGLHMEIERLQQKCSDLQFALAHQTASAETEAELRSIVVGLQADSYLNKDMVLNLQSELENAQQKIVELEEQLRWQELEKQNQLNIKEVKINALKRALNIDQGEGVGGGAICGGGEDKYATKTFERRRNSQPSASLKPSIVPPLELKMPSSSDAKTVFRNQLQRHKSLSSNYYHHHPGTSNITLEGASTRPKPWSISPKITVMTPANLPVDFKASVATLPPIEIKPMRTTSSKEINVQSLAIDTTDFIKTPTAKLKKNIIPNL